jgi:chromatin remodeling complex protein RSC6
MTGFNSPVIFSPELSSKLFSGIRVMSRAQAAARISAYANARGLRSPQDGKTFVLDDTLAALFPASPPVLAFREITRLLAPHVTRPSACADSALVDEADAWIEAYRAEHAARPPRPRRRRRSKGDARARHSSALQLRMRALGSGLYQPARLSPELAAVCGGADVMSRPEITQRIWVYIKDNALQDPVSRRRIRVDARLRAVCGSDASTIDCFEMSRYIAMNVTNA